MFSEIDSIIDFEGKEGTVNKPIRRRPDERMIREVHPEGKEAITHYRVEKQFKDYALVRLVLDTGRTHQIRVHMAYLGHPLLGDNFYGKDNPDNKGLLRAALHAGYIEFVYFSELYKIQNSSGIIGVLDKEAIIKFLRGNTVL